MVDLHLAIDRLPGVIALLVLVPGISLTGPQEVHALAFKCTGKDPQHILGRYGNSAGEAEYPVPLRCGNKSWGYKHFASRWSNSFESHLERTLNNPTVRQQAGTTKVVCRLVDAGSSRRKWFKVVHTTDATDRGKGIITAVWEDASKTCEKM